jgi:hypothetical protein
MDITEVLTAPQSPWQNPVAEKLVGSIRRECVDPAIVLGERHLRRTLRGYFDYYLGSKTHLSLAEDAPTARVVQGPGAGEIVGIPTWVACTIATNGALRNRLQPRPAVSLLEDCDVPRARGALVRSEA